MLYYKCPRCGTTELEQKEIKLRITSSVTMQPINVLPAWMFICVNCGWADTKKQPELLQTA